MAYEGNSIVDYLSSVGQASDYSSRSKLAAEKGISGYSGSASQNLQLLGMLRGSSASTAATSSPTTSASSNSNKQYGGWYDNPETGKNQRWWGGNTWTDGNEPGSPQNADEVTPYLNNYQNMVYSDSNAPEVKVPTMEELKTELAPTSELPDLLDREALYEQYRTKYGVSDLENALNQLKATEEEEVAAFRTQKYTEEGKPVAMNVISGRVSEEERQAQERLDFIARQKNTVIDELNTKYTIIGQFMEFAQLDYQDAVSRYESEFTRNVQMYEIISGKEAAARSAYEADRDSARANLQIYMNALTSGNVDYSTLSSDQKLMVSKLEVQSGLPVGFMSSIKKDANADIVFTTSNNGVTQVGIRNADGSISVQDYGSSTSKASSGGGGGSGASAYSGSGSGGGDTGNIKLELVEDVKGGLGLRDIFMIYYGLLKPNEILSLYSGNSPYGVAKESQDDINRIMAEAASTLGG